MLCDIYKRTDSDFKKKKKQWKEDTIHTDIQRETKQTRNGKKKKKETPNFKKVSILKTHNSQVCTLDCKADNNIDEESSTFSLLTFACRHLNMRLTSRTQAEEQQLSNQPVRKAVSGNLKPI